MEGSTNVFSLDRDLFYFLDNQKKPYGFILNAVKENRIYFLEFNKKINWLSMCFNSCDKENLYFGKQILNNISDYSKIISRIQKIYT